jgi:DegV family protein with EDD domain
MRFIAVTDTSGNLPSDRIRKAGLELIAFPYFIDGRAYTCLDTESFHGDDYYAKIKAGMKVTTSQISPQQYADCFEPWLRKGLDVVFVCMSSGISGSCNSARIAAQMLLEQYPERRVEVVDALGASLGEGLVALEAARLRDLELSAEEAAGRLRDLVRRMFNVFTVDDLMHLRRGGRLSNMAAIVGMVLNIKPLLKGDEEGKIVSFAKVRGRKKSIEELAARYDRLAVEPEKQIVGIAQAGCREDAAYLAKLLNRNHPPKEILTVEYEPVTGAHVGPGALALFFASHDKVRSEV